MNNLIFSYYNTLWEDPLKRTIKASKNDFFIRKSSRKSINYKFHGDRLLLTQYSTEIKLNLIQNNISSIVLYIFVTLVRMLKFLSGSH